MNDEHGMTGGRNGRTERGQVARRARRDARQATWGRRQRVAVLPGPGPAGGQAGVECVETMMTAASLQLSAYGPDQDEIHVLEGAVWGSR